MDEDASLDEFIDDDHEAEPADADTVDEADEDDAALMVDPSTVESATATHDWRPDGGACAACGEVVERRWRDDPGFVCGGCKDW